jgi:PAS domain S-box-containing protein
VSSPEPPDKSLEPLLYHQEPFRLLVEAIADYAIFMLDPSGHVASWNAGAERIKRYRADEILGAHLSRFYPPGDRARCDQLLATATAVGRVEDEGWRVRKDGSQFWANVVITAVRDGADRLVGFAKVTRDLTERRAAEDERLRLGRLARDRMQLLSELSTSLAAASSIEDVGRAVTEHGMRLAGADTCTLYLLDEATRTLSLIAERGCAPAVVDRIRTIGSNSGNPVYAVGAGVAPAIWIETALQYDAFLPALARLKVEGPRARAFWCVPLIAEGRRVGMIGVGFHEERQFPLEEREFIATFARQCAQAMVRAQRLQSERSAAALAERLRASLETTLRSIGDAVIATDAQGNIVLMNGVAESLTGWSERDAAGRHLTEVFRIINEQTRAVVDSPVDKVLQSGGVVGLANHTVLIARDGREIPIDDSGAPIRPHGGDGKIDGVVLVFRDVTSKKQDEARRMFLVDATSALAESLDHEATVARVARLAVPRLADWAAIDLVVDGQPLPKRLAVAHVDPTKVSLALEIEARYPPRADAPTGVPHVLRTGRSELYSDIPDELLVAGCADAEHLRLARSLGLRSAMVVPLTVRGRVLGAMSFVHAESGRRYDEDDLQFAEELARRCANAIENALLFSSEQDARRSADIANRAKDEFLAVVSHELRNPLNAILGWAKLLTLKDFDARKVGKGLETIERNAVAMAQLIEDLLDMSRIISGKMRLEVQPIDVARIVEASMESIRPAANAKGVEMRPLIDPATPKLHGDPTRLQQVIWNLLSNAVKFTPKDGRVDVQVRPADGRVEIIVVDTGKGMAPDFVPFVFDPFRQEEGGPARTRGGLGLGLAITRQLVELHGGRITAHSDGEGKGATFTVNLPVAKAGAAVSRPDRRPLPAPMIFERPLQLRGLRVLVVDDDDDARSLVANVLEDCGSRVTTAASAREALTRLAEEVPDVLLSDISMPEEDGYSLIRKVRALPRDRGGDVPAAAITAYARPEDRRDLLNAGFSIHLPKPIEPAELVAVVATLSRFLPRP